MGEGHRGQESRTLGRLVRSVGLLAVLCCVACTAKGPSATTSTTAPVAETEEQTADQVAHACHVGMPDEWRERLRVPDGEGKGPYALLIAADADGNRFDAQYEEAGPGEPSQVLLLWTGPDASTTVVVDLRDEPGKQVLAGAFDGRYLAFSVYENNALFSSPWVGYVWDSRSAAPGQPREFARSTEATYPDGTPGALPLMYPLVREGVVYWVEYEPLGEGSTDRTLFSYDIVDDSLQEVATGTFNRPFLLGQRILTISMSDDEQVSTLTQIPLQQDPEQLPAGISTSPDVQDVATGEGSVAWIEGDQIFLLDPSVSDEPSLIVGPDGTFGTEVISDVASLQLNGEILLFYAVDDQDEVQQYVYDRRTHSYFTNDELEGSSADFAAHPGSLALHHTDAQGNTLIGRPVLAPMSELPPLPGCG